MTNAIESESEVQGDPRQAARDWYRERWMLGTHRIAELAELLREWRELGDASGGGYGGDLRERTDDVLRRYS